MRVLRVALVAATVVLTLPALGESVLPWNGIAEGSSDQTVAVGISQVLSPIWGASIRQWSDQISREAKASGLDPDFIAAVINAESNGNHVSISRVGAVGLMGVMPAGPGLEWRPSPEALSDPDTNLNWGVAILAEIIRQSGGDLVAALAAYSGGWDYAGSRVPQEYAARVLNEYGKAVAARSDVSPEIASEWTIAMEIRRGHIPVEPIILSEEPVSGMHKYGEHVVYNYVDRQGRAFFVKGYAVPLVVVVPLEVEPESLDGDTVNDQLLARLGMSEIKISKSNPQVLLACLPSLSRLRGRLSTRWFAPTSCPSWHR